MTQPGKRRSMTTAELEARCRAIVAEMVEASAGGDPILARALLDGLAARGAIKAWPSAR
jgi:hypothetical protein